MTVETPSGEVRAAKLETELDEANQLIDWLGQICCGVAFTSGQYEEHNERALRVSTCAYCDEEAPRTSEAMTAHAERCEKHPLSKALAFKTYVHKRLDDAGVPADPEPQTNAKTGCRIEGRLNWLIHGRDAQRKMNEATHAAFHEVSHSMHLPGDNAAEMLRKVAAERDTAKVELAALAKSVRDSCSRVPLRAEIAQPGAVLAPRPESLLPRCPNCQQPLKRGPVGGGHFDWLLCSSCSLQWTDLAVRR